MNASRSDQPGAPGSPTLVGHTGQDLNGQQPQNGVASSATAKPRRARKDDVEFRGFARRMIRAYGRRAAQADPWVLKDLLALREDMDAAIADAVTAYKAAGLSWAMIGQELGIDRVTAFKRYGHLVRDEQAS